MQDEATKLAAALSLTRRALTLLDKMELSVIAARLQHVIDLIEIEAQPRSGDACATLDD